MKNKILAFVLRPLTLIRRFFSKRNPSKEAPSREDLIKRPYL